MDTLYSTKQLQKLLKIDRITIYRMLNDGRLNGVKIGSQWRFTQKEVDRLMGEVDAAENEVIKTVSDFPSNCMKDLQDIFAGIIGIGAISITMHGTLLIEPTISNPFCRLMLSSEVGRRACQQSWDQIIENRNESSDFQTCHAGLSYKRSPIFSDGIQIAWLIAGQFYLQSPDRDEKQAHITALSKKYDIPTSKLLETSSKIPVLSQSQIEQVQHWNPRIAETIQLIICERSDLMRRLRQISQLSSINIMPTE